MTRTALSVYFLVGPAGALALAGVVLHWIVRERGR